MRLTQQQSDLLVGTLLGDGNLQTETNGRTWRYRALQKAEYKDYLDHKYEVMKDYCTTGPIYSEVYDEPTRAMYQRWYFNTNVSNSFLFYGNMFYKYDPELNRMVKDVPLKIEKFLTPRAVAYWYQDDGALKWLGRSNAMRICTESFSEDGIQRLQRSLKNLYGITTTKVKKTKKVNNQTVLVGYRIAIHENSSTAFRELIRPYLIDCMKYKVSNGNRGHL